MYSTMFIYAYMYPCVCLLQEEKEDKERKAAQEKQMLEERLRKDAEEKEAALRKVCVCMHACSRRQTHRHRQTHTRTVLQQ